MAKKYFKDKLRSECLETGCECLRCVNISDFFIQPVSPKNIIESSESGDGYKYKFFETPDLHQAFFDDFESVTNDQPFNTATTTEARCSEFTTDDTRPSELSSELYCFERPPRVLKTLVNHENVQRQPQLNAQDDASAAEIFRRQNAIWQSEGFGSGSSTRTPIRRASESASVGEQLAEGANLNATELSDVNRDEESRNFAEAVCEAEKFERIEIVQGGVRTENWKGVYSKITTKVMMKGVCSAETLFAAFEELCCYVSLGMFLFYILSDGDVG